VDTSPRATPSRRLAVQATPRRRAGMIKPVISAAYGRSREVLWRLPDRREILRRLSFISRRFQYGGRGVLVADDNLVNLRLLADWLTSENYVVSTATNGFEALVKIEAEEPDIVLLDVVMPGIDGFETCRRIKADPAKVHIPVIMVTALQDTDDLVRGFEAGANDFLTRTKPICEDGSETALYRGSGRLFRPRPGPTSLSRVKNSTRWRRAACGGGRQKRCLTRANPRKSAAARPQRLAVPMATNFTVALAHRAGLAWPDQLRGHLLVSHTGGYRRAQARATSSAVQ
jgi:CheY-like chemotaxis protein